MVQLNNQLRVLEVFFHEPMTIQFIKSISKRLKLAHPSVRAYIKELEKEELIKKKKSKPFDGFVANRDNRDFIFYKRVYNFYTMKELVVKLEENYYPKLIVLFGSYSRGEDIEDSDVDLLLITKTRKEIVLKEIENKLVRKINLTILDKLDKLDKDVLANIHDGILLSGSWT